MNKYTLRLAHFSARGIIFLTILLAAVFLLQMMNIPERPWIPSKTSYFTIDITQSFLSDFCGLIYFLQTPLILVLFACFHDYARDSFKVYSRISLGLIISFTSLRTLGYIAGFALDRFNYQAYGDDRTLYFTHSMFQSITTAVTVTSLKVFQGLAVLFIIPIFSKAEKNEKYIRLTLCAAGAMFLLSALLFFFTDNSEISAFCMVCGQLSFCVALFLFIKFFSHSAQKSMGDNNTLPDKDWEANFKGTKRIL